MNSVLDEYASLTQEVLENYDDAAHPELPWYTGIVANTMRSSLYYGFKDFDGNGVPELVIAAGTDDYRQPVAIYAFDGQKMVYLCKDHPLGERCFLSGLKDGVFAEYSTEFHNLTQESVITISAPQLSDEEKDALGRGDKTKYLLDYRFFIDDLVVELTTIHAKGSDAQGDNEIFSNGSNYKW